jgi:hypothetical protein
MTGPRPTGGIASRRLEAVSVALRQGEPTLGDLSNRLGSAGFGLAILVFALPGLIPIPGPVGFVFGSATALLALQILFGATRLWMPRSLRRRRIPGAALATVVDRALPWLRKVEVWLKPRRWRHLSGRRARMVLALPILVMAVVLALPIPFGNMLPALALVFFALGLLERDGYAVLAGLGTSVAALAWTAFLILAGAEATERLVALFK